MAQPKQNLCFGSAPQDTVGTTVDKAERDEAAGHETLRSQDGNGQYLRFLLQAT
jgi:hypothetical protein